MSKKELPKFEDLIKTSDEHIKIAKENLNIEFTFVESDIVKSDEPRFATR